MSGGSRTWYFPDGYLPAKTGKGAMEAHEALMLLNTGKSDAKARIDIYFSGRAPFKKHPHQSAGGTRHRLRMDKPSDMGGANIPLLTQYALESGRIKNSCPIRPPGHYPKQHGLLWLHGVLRLNIRHWESAEDGP